MEFDERFSQEEPISRAVQEEQAMRLLDLIESRTAYLIYERRQAVELILNSEPLPRFGTDEFQQRYQKVLSGLTIDELEDYAPQWMNMISSNSRVQSAVSHLLAHKYGLIYEGCPNIRQALGLDGDAVKETYQSQYGKPLSSLFQIQDESDEEKKASQTPSKEEKEGRHKLAEEFEWVELSANDFLFEQGDIGDALYVVVHGRLRVIVELDGVREVVREVAASEIVGEMALITDEPRSATLQAVRDARLLKLSKANFERLIVRHPEVMIQIARIQSKRVRLLSVRPPHSTGLASLAVIPSSTDVPLGEFCQRLVSALSRYGSCLHLSSQRLEDEIQVDPLLHDEYHTLIVAWLSEQEAKHRFIVYESDLQPSSWTSRCLRQADHILIVAQANAPSELGEIELELAHLSDVRKSLLLLHPNGNHQPVGTKKWLTPRQVDRHYHLRWNMDRDFERIARLLTGNGVGLVLSSGGATGLAHIGVIRALEEEGIPIDMVGGTSQGAWICGMYAMGWDYKSMMTTVQEVIKKASRPVYTLPMVSLLTGKTMSKALKMLFGEQHIEDLWLNYFCVSANLTDGKMMVHESGLLWKYVRASSSLPGIIPPFIEDENILIDGAAVNNLPTDMMRKFIQNGIVLASNILPDLENTEKALSQKEQYGEALSGWRVLWRRLNPFAKPLNLPSIADVMYLSVVLSNRNTVEERKKVTDFQIDLDLSAYSIFDFDAYEALVEIGYQTAQKNIADWKKNGQWARKGLERLSR